MTAFHVARGGRQVIRRWGVVMVAACLALPALAAAQSPRDKEVLEALDRIRTGETVRVVLLLERWTGALQHVGGDTLFIASRGQLPMGIRFNAIDTLWRRSSHARRGAWIGGVTGLLAGGYVAAILARMSEAETGSDDVVVTAIPAGFLGAAGGAAIGALTGGLIGSGFRRWQLVFP
jgi:hypothetical protein